MRYTLVLALLAPLTPAQEPAGKTLALNGLDPVTLCQGKEVAGKEDLTAEHGHYRYHFSNEANRSQFLTDPERWGIQWGGGCGRMGPLSGRGDPDRFAVYDEHIYIFASDGCRDGFLSAPERFVIPALPAAPASEKEAKEGRELIEKAVTAHGGAELVDGARALRLGFERESSGWTNLRELLITASGQVRSRSRWTPPAGSDSPTDTAWVVGSSTFVIEDGKTTAPLSPDQEVDVRRSLHREPLALLWARHLPDFRARAIGSGKLGGDTVANVEVSFDGLTTTLHLDPQICQILGISWHGRLSDGMTRDITERFVGWKGLNDVYVPIRREVSVDGKVQEALGAAVAWDTFEMLELIPEAELRMPTGR